MKLLLLSLGLLVSPRRSWAAIAELRPSLATTLLGHTIPLALIAPICWYVGVTETGWTVGSGEPWRLTAASALPLVSLFYLVLVAGVLFLGAMVRWMTETYGSDATLADGVTLISATATPFFISGVIGLAPMLWPDILIGTAVACYCIYLLYSGAAPMLRVGRDISFLYASAVFGVALVGFVGLLGATVVLWDFGLEPQYAY